MNAHFSRDPRKECQRKFNDGMKPHKSSDSRIHFFNRDRGVSASKSMNPSSGADTIRHDFGSLPDIVHLRVFNARHHIARIVKPLFCKHNR
jgi:hypothetical protein